MHSEYTHTSICPVFHVSHEYMDSVDELSDTQIKYFLRVLCCGLMAFKVLLCSSEIGQPFIMSHHVSNIYIFSKMCKHNEYVYILENNQWVYTLSCQIIWHTMLKLMQSDTAALS